MASSEEWIGWCSCSVARNSRQGTIALRGGGGEGTIHDTTEIHTEI